MVSECTCNGLKIIKEMTDFYTDNAVRHVRGEPRSRIIHQKSKELADRLYNKLTEKEIVQYNVSDIILRNADINRFKRGCEDGIGSDCVAKLEMLRQMLHNNSDAREKLVCTEEPEKFKRGFRGESPLADDVRSLMGKLFTGEYIDPDTGKLYWNPFKTSINKQIREECGL